MLLAKLRAAAHLTRWLAPVTPEHRAPENVARRSVTVAATPTAAAFEAYVYTPTDRPVVGAYLVVPGLHYLGPADPRLDRFLRVLAGAGMVVLSPFLPDFCGLRVAPGVLADTERAFLALLALPERPRHVRPGVFSISFGSLPALRLAASPRVRDEVGALVIFGGYADWSETIRFSLTGEVGGRPLHVRDPLNQPVIFMNVFDDLPDPPGDPEAVLAAWREYVERTWGRPEMKARERHGPIARELAGALASPADRRLFLVGCGLEPGGYALFEAALARGGDPRDYVDPRPHLSGIRCPVHLFHGVDDDVIPYTQLDALARAMPDAARTHTYLTGLYAHTGAGQLAGRVRELPALGRELFTMARMVGALVAAGTTR